MLPFFGKNSRTYLFAWIDVKYQVAYKFKIWLDKLKRSNFITKKERKVKGYFFYTAHDYCTYVIFFALQVYQKLDSEYVVDARLTINEYGNHDFDLWSKM